MQPSLGQLRTNGATLKKQLENHSSYQQLKSEQKKRVIDGKEAILMNNEKILEEADIDRALYYSHYRMYSQHIHTFPLSIEAVKAFQTLDDKALELLSVQYFFPSQFMTFWRSSQSQMRKFLRKQET
jgi:hypothetical protein